MSEGFRRGSRCEGRGVGGLCDRGKMRDGRK